METITIELTPTVAELLAVLSESGSAKATIETLIDRAQQGVYRPMANEREWVEQVFGTEWKSKLEEGDPYGRANGSMFERPIQKVRHPIFEEAITDATGAKRLLRYLRKHDLTFHPDDDPAHTIDTETGKLVFNAAEADALWTRIADMDNVDFGVFEDVTDYSLMLDEGYRERLKVEIEGDTEALEVFRAQVAEIEADTRKDDEA